MHLQAFQYIARNTHGLPDGPVLEIGSYNVNGSIRGLFEGRPYHGIDARPGPGVDEVADGADYRTEARYAVVVSTETLEHAPDPQAVLDSARACLQPGGVLLMTAAGPARAPHSCNGSTVVPPGEHYANIAPADLAAWLADWQDVVIEEDHSAGDIYARAVRP